MKLPRDVPVMTLPNATLFPQALLPLYIFEPRYRRMLADALQSNRMFTVAMQKPGSMRESPAHVGGLGLIRVSVGHRDGTSHLILQGIARVELRETVRYRPYRIQRVRTLKAPSGGSVEVDALVAKVRELLEDRLGLGLPFPFPVFSGGQGIKDTAKSISAAEVFQYLAKVEDPGQFADLVSCAVLAGASDRQTILQAVGLEERLRHLIHFLIAEIRKARKNPPHE